MKKEETVYLEVWVTKYWNTEGIAHYPEVTHQPSKEWINTRDKSYTPSILKPYWHIIFKPYWHTSLKEAKAHVEQLRKKKIVSLKKQLKKIEQVQVKPLLCQRGDLAHSRNACFMR